MYTVGQLAKAFEISRSTLLYYDKKGLLKPSARSAANYRRYSDLDYQRLQKIMNYRDTGLSLFEIKKLLNGESDNQRISILAAQLDNLNKSIAQLREQQQIIVDMIGHDAISRTTRSMNKKQWVELLSSIGLSEKEMIQWHIEFERRMPEAHKDFLQSLNIPKDEIKSIRKRSQKG